jgi:hypothetical protein
MEQNKTVVSPNKKHAISFGKMHEQAMGGAYYCPIFIENLDDGEKILLHERSTGNAVFKGNNAVFFPIWVRDEKDFLMQRLAFFDLKKSRISIFEKLYNFIEIKAIKGNKIQAIENPHWHPKNIEIDIKTETIEKSMPWTKIDSDIVAIKQRLLLATNGNWYYFQEGRDHTSGSSFIMTNVPNRADWHNSNRGEDFYINGATHADNEFIAHARQDIPMLLGEIERLNNSKNKAQSRKMTTNWADLGKKLGTLQENGGEILAGPNNFAEALEEILGEKWLHDSVDAFIEGRKGSHLAIKTVGFLRSRKAAEYAFGLFKKYKKTDISKANLAIFALMEILNPICMTYVSEFLNNKTYENLGIALLRNLIFDGHHSYKKDDLEALFSMAEKIDSETVGHLKKICADN